MTSNSKRIILIISAIFVVIFFLLIASTFLKKNDKETLNQVDHQEEQRAEDIEEKMIEKENIKSFLEKFVVIYNSYTWGSFSNIESQYSSMSKRMKDEEEGKVEQIKKETENKPREYFSTRASLIDSEFLLYSEDKVEIIINLNIQSFSGAIVQRETTILVDAEGNHYVGDLNDLIIDSNNKKIKVNCIRIGNECKVDKIENINE